MNADQDSTMEPAKSDKPDAEEKKTSWFRQSFNPFRIATLRGLAVLLPPLLTIMLFAWAWNTIDRVILRPVESLSENAVALSIEDIRENDEIEAELATAENPVGRIQQEPGGPTFFHRRRRDSIGAVQQSMAPGRSGRGGRRQAWWRKNGYRARLLQTLRANSLPQTAPRDPGVFGDIPGGNVSRR